MKIAIPKERAAGESRVAASIEVIGKLVGLGCDVVIEASAGEGASIADETFKKAGASIAKDFAATVKGANMVWKITAPSKAEIGKLTKGQIVCAHLSALTDAKGIEEMAKAGLSGYAME